MPMQILSSKKMEPMCASSGAGIADSSIALDFSRVFMGLVLLEDIEPLSMIFNWILELFRQRDMFVSLYL
jgi:hypothetical protein